MICRAKATGLIRGGSLLVLVLAGSARPGVAQEAESFGGDIVLGRPTDRSVTVSALFASDQDVVYLEYGGQAGQLTSRTLPRANVRAGVPYVELIDGLQPNRRYFYRVRYQSPGGGAPSASAEHAFVTQRAPGSTFTFTVVADSHLFTEKHCNPARYALTLRNARDDAPDFHIDLGDTFRSDSIVKDPKDLTYAKVFERERAHRPYFEILTHSAPLSLVLGNHDSEYLWYARSDSGQNPNLPIWATNARKTLFPNPAPDGFYSGDETLYPEVEGGPRESCYAWEWGDALFVVLDPYWGMGQRGGSSWDPVHGDAQYFWFRDTLRRSRARYKFVFEHHVLGQTRGGVEVARRYEWGGVDPAGARSFAQMRSGWDKPMHDLMVENGVSIYFQGHDHLLAKGVLDGVTYVTVPMPGAGPPGSRDAFAGNENAGNADAYTQSVVLPNSGHLRVTVSPVGVRVDYVSVKLPDWDAGVNGVVAYSFEVR
jgi:hypothetical protein